MGDKTAQIRNVCTKCYGNPNGVCQLGGDVNDPPSRREVCPHRVRKARELIVDAAIARAVACPWPKQNAA